MVAASQEGGGQGEAEQGSVEIETKPHLRVLS